MAAVEVDDIPDIYKLRRGGGSKMPWIIGGLVVLGLASIAIVAMVLGGDGGDDGGTGVGKIDVVSTPAGGTVYIDGEPLDQKTPAVFRKARAGKTYIVAVELSKHQRWESEAVVPEGETGIKVIAKLEPLTVRLTVETTPSDAEVFLNAKSYGRTPLSLDGLAPEAATELVLKHRNYLPIRRRLDWSTDIEKALNFELKKF